MDNETDAPKKQEYWFWAWRTDFGTNKRERVVHIVPGTSEALHTFLRNQKSHYYAYTEDGGGYTFDADELKWDTVQVREVSG